MRDKKKAFLSCAMVAALALLASPAAMAHGSSSCSLTLSFEVTKDDAGVQTPCAVSFDNSGVPRCAGPNEAAAYTGIRYKNTGSSLDHAAILVTGNNNVVVPPGSQVIKNCEGDQVTGLGKRTCHADTVKLNGVPSNQKFWVVVEGRQVPIATTIAAKKGSSTCIKSVATTGLGLTASSSQLIQQVQRVTSQDGCAVDFVTDALTGDPISVKLTPESIVNGCRSPSLVGTDGEIAPLDADEFEVFRGSESFGTWKFGEGYIRSGTNSCTTRVIGGRVYTWGDPCPD